MAETQYYYSKDGTETEGPVSEDALRELVRQGGLDSTSFVCREGETEWKPLDPDAFQAPSPEVPARPAPAGSKRRQKKGGSSSSKKSFDPGFQSALLIISWVAVLGGAALGVHLQFVVFSATEPAADSIFVVIGYFLAGAAAIAIFPYLISLAFQERHRALPRAIAIVCFAVIFVLLRYYFLASDADAATATGVPDAATIVLPGQN